MTYNKLWRAVVYSVPFRRPADLNLMDQINSIPGNRYSRSTLAGYFRKDETDSRFFPASTGDVIRAAKAIIAADMEYVRILPTKEHQEYLADLIGRLERGEPINQEEEERILAKFKSDLFAAL